MVWLNYVLVFVCVRRVIFKVKLSYISSIYMYLSQPTHKCTCCLSRPVLWAESISVEALAKVLPFERSKQTEHSSEGLSFFQCRNGRRERERIFCERFSIRVSRCLRSGRVSKEEREELPIKIARDIIKRAHHHLQTKTLSRSATDLKASRPPFCMKQARRNRDRERENWNRVDHIFIRYLFAHFLYIASHNLLSFIA